MSHVIVRNPKWADALGPHQGVASLDELRETNVDDKVLICFSTGIIVPPDVLSRARAAYNFHGASPEFPGRDPHHWAIYRGAAEYGVTCHVMTDRVDDGPILAVERFLIPPNTKPRQLLAMAETRLVRFYQRMLPSLLGGTARPSGEHWGAPKTTRSDFLAICKITPNMPRDEFERRHFAFDGEGFDNLYIELHGRRWQISPNQA